MTFSPHRPPAAWDRLRKVPADVLVADYHLGPDCVNLFLIQASQVERHRIPLTDWDLPKLAGLSPGRSRGLGAVPVNPLPDNASLVAPVFARARDCSLVYLMPHGPLEHYPLHAMNVGGRNLLDCCPVIYVPCVSMLPPEESVLPTALRPLVMGNMTGDLGGAEREAIEVADILGVQPYLGEDATLETLCREAPGKDLIHIAGHGFFDPAAPLASGIPFPDGILTVRHVHDLRLNDCLVVLSGCVTGLGDERPGEGFSSLVGAFLAAGARGLLVSLWNVDDNATCRFMVALYASAVKGGIALPAALQSSFLTVRRQAESQDPRTAPFYWAPFKPVGRW